MLPDISGQLKILKEAAAAVPAVRFAIGVVGLAAAASISLLLLGSGRAAVAGVAFVLVGMIVVFLFSRIVKGKHSTSTIFAAQVMLWLVVVTIIVSTIAVATAILFGEPKRVLHLIGLESLASDETKVPPVKSAPVGGDIDAASCSNSVNRAYDNLSNELYSDVRRNVESIRHCAPIDYYNILGSVAFFEKRFAISVINFATAYKISFEDGNIDPTKDFDILKRNLADAYVEAGRVSDAIKIYGEIEDKNSPLWQYKMGHAHLYADEYLTTLDYLHSLPIDFADEGNPGKVGVTKAAAQIGLSKMSVQSQDSSQLMDTALSLLREVRDIDCVRWRDILIRGNDPKEEGYSRARDILRDGALSIFSSCSDR